MICPSQTFNDFDLNVCVWHFDVRFYILKLSLVFSDYFCISIYFNHFWHFDNSDTQKISGLLQMRHISKAHWARFRWSCLGPRQKLGAFVENALEVPKRVDLQRAALHFKERWILWKGNQIFIVMVLRKSHFLILGEHMIELIDVDSALLLIFWILKYSCAMPRNHKRPWTSQPDGACLVMRTSRVAGA